MSFGRSRAMPTGRRPSTFPGGQGLLLACSAVSMIIVAAVLAQGAGAENGRTGKRTLTVTSHIPKINGVSTSQLEAFERSKEDNAYMKQFQQQKDLQAGVSLKRRSLLRGAGEFTANPNWDCSADFADCDQIRPLMKFKAANIDPFGLLNWTIPCTLRPVQAQADVADKPRVNWWQCDAARAYVCKSWIGVACTPGRKVSSLNVNPINLFPPMGQGDIVRSLWGNWTTAQSIPPELAELQELTFLDLARNYETGTYLGGLIGTIPDSLSKLTKLTFLSLGYNRLWGSIPQGLGNLASLQYLRLNLNNFTGSIPSALGNLRNLTALYLGSNDGMESTLPESLGGLVSLQYLSLSALPLTGTLPASMSALTDLGTLDLTATGLSGPLPVWLSNMKKLGSLMLDKNQFSGTLPVGYSALSNLGSLGLSSNRLSGSIPTAMIEGLCRSQTLFIIDLSENELTGPFPYGISKCPNMGAITLSSNALSGNFPPLSFFQAMPTLNQFLVADNRLTGTVPTDLTSQSMLATLLLGGNQLTGPVPRIRCQNTVLNFNFSYNAFSGSLDDVLDIANLTGCMAPSDQMPGAFETANITLDLSHNSLSGRIPPTFLTLPGMLELRLHNNSLEGAIPENFNCTRLLQVFTASGNNLTGSIPSALGSCTGLQNLALAGNKLTGTIPQSLQSIGASLQNLELQQNLLTGSIPGTFNYFQQLRTLNLSGNSLSGQLHPNISQLPSLVKLDLSGNKIEGPLPAEMGNLTIMQSMVLRNNALSGSIPVSIAPPNMPYLTFLDLSQNALSGPIPWGFTNTSAGNLTINLSQNNLSGPIPGGANSTFALTLPESAVAGNPGLCGGSGYPPCPDPNAGQLSLGALIGICVGAGIALVGIAGLTYWLIRKRNEWAGGTMLVFEKLDFHLTVDDILEATENFSDKYKLGRGGFGTVYSATLQDGRTVAIKRLALQSTQGDREFQAEMQTLGNIRHRNLVVLVAAYIAPAPSSERLLIYNFLSGGSLDNILSGAKDMPKDSPYRQWEVRRRIALDVARGLKYLHHDCTPRIIHRDMKPANVLMDDQLVAHVADFGLAREIDATKTHMSTAVFGTIGYLAPEYTQRGRLTFKSDVFAYGVLLLQLITGKQPTDEDVAERGLARWVGASATASVMDDRMDIGPYTNQILGAIKLGLLCTSRVPADRPSMAEVVHLLENLDDFAKGITAPEDTPQGKPDESV